MQLFAKALNKEKKCEDGWARSKKKGCHQSLPVGYDDFELGRLLGQGGFAKCYAAKLRGKNVAAMDVAIRVGRIEEQRIWDGRTLTDEEMRELLDWLIGLADRVHNTHICKQLGWRMDRKHVYEITELMQGGELFDRICAGPDGHLTEDEARRMSKALCLGLAGAHEKGFIHRDLKPENIMIRTKDGDLSDVCILDWGSCTQPIPPDKVHYLICGTPGYIAPEMLSGKGYGRAVDSWSMGICIYESLTGRSPWLQSTPEALQLETLERDIPWPAKHWQHISREGIDFVKRLLDKNPRRRMLIPDALQHPWLQESQPLVVTLKADPLDLQELTAELPKAITMRETRRTMATAAKPHPLAAAI